MLKLPTHMAVVVISVCRNICGMLFVDVLFVIFINNKKNMEKRTEHLDSHTHTLTLVNHHATHYNTTQRHVSSSVTHTHTHTPRNVSILFHVITQQCTSFTCLK